MRAAERLRVPRVEMDLRPVLERRLAGQEGERDIEALGRRVQAGAAATCRGGFRPLLDTSQGQGDALPGMARFGCCVLHMQAAHAHALPGGESSSGSPASTLPEKAVPVTTVPAPDRVKHAVDGEAETAFRGACRQRRAVTRWARSAAMPAPVTAETGKSGASASAAGQQGGNLPLTCARRSGLARSAW